MDVLRAPNKGQSLIPEPTFERLTDRIEREYPVDAEMARRIMDQTAAFLAACATSTEPLAPSQMVDIGWHTFILYTRDYAAFCEVVAGRFIHHVPHEAGAETGEGDTQAVLDRSAEAIRAAGFAVDWELWRADIGKCSQCHNGCADDPAPNPNIQ